MQDKTVPKRRKEVFGNGYVSDRLQSAHEQSLASSSSAADESQLFDKYMRGLRVKRASNASRTKAVPR